MGTNFFKVPAAYRMPTIRNGQNPMRMSKSVGHSSARAAAKDLASAAAMSRIVRLKPLQKKV